MEQKPRKVAALYARVSTLDQNCEVQLEDLRRHAGKRFASYCEYTDAGVSGTQRHRPQLDALMRDARRRLFDVVLVWKFDRFARSLKHLIESLDEFSALGIDFISYTEGVDTTTPSGQLLFHIVGAVAQFERDLIAERVRAGMAHAKSLGKHIGPPRQGGRGGRTRFAVTWEIAPDHRDCARSPHFAGPSGALQVGHASRREQ